MIRHPHLDDLSVIDEDVLARLLATPHVDGYLRTLDAEVPGLDRTIDRAVSEGFHVVQTWRHGSFDGLHRLRLIARHTFDEDEYDALASAAIPHVSPLTMARPSGTPLSPRSSRRRTQMRRRAPEALSP